MKNKAIKVVALFWGRTAEGGAALGSEHTGCVAVFDVYTQRVSFLQRRCLRQ